MPQDQLDRLHAIVYAIAMIVVSMLLTAALVTMVVD